MTADATELVIRAIGNPAPQGSKSFKGMRNGHAILAESSKAVDPWRKAVEAAARTAMQARGDWLALDCPAVGVAWFFLPRPQRMPADRIVDGVAYPSAYPDVTKLIRSTEDALKIAGVVRDDARFVDWTIRKRYCEPGQPTGARIVVRALAAQGAVV
jgi:Holliday junction resolvase RusA-like endonuclease